MRDAVVARRQKTIIFIVKMNATCVLQKKPRARLGLNLQADAGDKGLEFIASSWPLSFLIVFSHFRK